MAKSQAMPVVTDVEHQQPMDVSRKKAGTEVDQIDMWRMYIGTYFGLLCAVTSMAEMASMLVLTI